MRNKLFRLATKVLRKGKGVAGRLIQHKGQSAKSDIVISPDYFVSPERVYLASADNFKGLEGLVEAEYLLPCKHFYSVIGGMGGLNILCRLADVKTITWFDINPHTVDICQLVLKLILSASSREDFISLIYCKPFSRNTFPPENVANFYEQPVSEVLRERLLKILTQEEYKTYLNFFFPYTSSPQQEFVLGPSLHCTSLRVYHDVLIEDIMTYPFLSREHIQAHKTKSINSYFYGKGWLRTSERFENVRRLLSMADVSVERKSIFDIDPQDGSGLYSSNVLEGTEGEFDGLINKFNWMVWYSRRTRFLIAEYIFGDRHKIPCEKVFSAGNQNPHRDCCLILEEILSIRSRCFIEIIHPQGMEGMNSGFKHYRGQRKVHVNNYLAGHYEDQDGSLVIVHMLLGNGCSFKVWGDVIRQAVYSGLAVCVLEHNPTAGEWPELEVTNWNIPPIVMIDEYLLSITNDWRKYGTLSLTGKGVRNYCWILGV